MSARNSPAGFGWVSRALHWAIAAGIIGMLGLGTWLARTEPSLGTLWLYALHKSIGLTLLILVLGRLVWHRISPPPAPVPGPRWQQAAARASHLALYALMLAVPLTGWLASSASGLDTLFWGWVVPPITPESEALQDGFFAAHGVLTKLLMAVIVLHAGAALWHARRPGDATLRRMVRGA